MDKPNRRPCRRGPILVEPLEGRALLSAVNAATPPEQTQLIVTPSSYRVSQTDGSFQVTVSLSKERSIGTAATLAEPLTVDFNAVDARSLGAASGTVSPFFAPVAVYARSLAAASGTVSPFFAPVHETVTFPAGASAETITVPIVFSEIATTPAIISLRADPTPGSMVIAADHAFPVYSAQVQLSGGPMVSPPTITGSRLVTDGRLASAVVIGFNKPMARSTVEDVGNYRILSRATRTSRSGFLFQKGSTSTEINSFPIASANYDSSTSTVTLTLKRPALASSLYEVSSAFPLQGHELTDTEGRAIANEHGSSMQNGFIRLIRPIPGFTPRAVGPLRTHSQTASPFSKLPSIKLPLHLDQ